MIIEYYADGAMVTYTPSESDYADYVGITGVRLPGDTDADIYDVGRFKCLVAFVATAVNCESETDLEHMMQTTVKQIDRYTYIVGNVSGIKQRKINADGMSYVDGFVQDDDIDGFVQNDDDQYIWDADVIDEPIISPTMYRKLEMCQNDRCREKGIRQVFGGTDTVPGLKRYIPPDLRDAVIYVVNGFYYIIGCSTESGNATKSVSPEYVIEHGRKYAGRKKTEKIISLLID